MKLQERIVQALLNDKTFMDLIDKSIESEVENKVSEEVENKDFRDEINDSVSDQIGEAIQDELQSFDFSDYFEEDNLREIIEDILPGILQPMVTKTVVEALAPLIQQRN